MLLVWVSFLQCNIFPHNTDFFFIFVVNWPGKKTFSLSLEICTKINYGLDAAGEKEKRMSKKNVDRRSTSSHDNKKFRTRSVGKQREMAFGFRKTATVVKKTGQIDIFSFTDCM